MKREVKIWYIILTSLFLCGIFSTLKSHFAAGKDGRIGEVKIRKNQYDFIISG